MALSLMSDSLKPLFFALVLLVIICVGWYFMIYRPDASKLEAIQTEAQNLMLKLQSFRVSDRQIAALESQIGKMQNDIKAKQKKIISKDDLAVIVQEIQRKGRTFGLKFDTVIPDYESLMHDPDTEEGSEEILKLTVHMKLQGFYKSFGRFVESLNTLPFYLSIGEMTLVYNEKIYPEVEILVDTVLYLRVTSDTQIKT